MTGEPRLIPGSHKIVSTAMAHHGYTAGSIIVIDPEKGVEGMTPITRFTPDISFPETEPWPVGGAYCKPNPQSALGGKRRRLGTNHQGRMAHHGRTGLPRDAPIGRGLDRAAGIPRHRRHLWT